MPLSTSTSNPALASDADGTTPGPLSAPSSTIWRRQRLLQIGNPTPEVNETSALNSEANAQPTYGSGPSLARKRSKKGLKRSLSVLPHLRIPRLAKTTSASASPSPRSPLSFRDSYFTAQRPISAYDTPVVEDNTDASGTEYDARMNGIRVWYSSFTSIDWLHDAIKDSVRRSRLRRGKSKRARVRRQLDRSVGWIIVSLVGFFTAVSAFLIVRSEQWLFDLKDGYCHEGWWKAKRFCCPESVDGALTALLPLSVLPVEDPCSAWRTWSDVFGPLVEKSGKWTNLEADIVEYVAYTAIALTLATISALLTVHLTASTTFVTRKDSGVLAPDFATADTDWHKVSDALTEPKRKVLYYAAGSGIPEIKTILSGFVIHGYLGGRVLFTKAVGIALAVASGLSLGKEGPFVHIASCIGNIISRFFSKYETNEGKRREILSAASAAGVAVAFGAPIGGVLFSLEEVSYFFPAKVMWRSFFCAMVAAVTLRFLDPFGSGKVVLFQVTYDKNWHAYELIPFLFLGVFGGVWGGYFSKLNFRWSRDVRSKTWLKDHPVIEVILVTGLSSVLCFLNPYTRMSGTELVYNLFAECRSGSSNTHEGLCIVDPPRQAMAVIRAIFIAMAVKSVLTLITFGIKVPAGIFIPSLGAGACAGRIVGILMQWLQYSRPNSVIFKSCKGDLDCVIPGLYAMVGAAATLSGVTRTTVSLAVIVFELTDTLTYAVPVMLSVLVAKTVADAIEPKGLYDLVIDLSQLPYLDAKRTYVWGVYQITDVMDRDVDVVRVDRDNTVKTLRDQLQGVIANSRFDSGFPILRVGDEGMRMIGYIGASELEHALSIVADDADMNVSFYPTTPYRDSGIMTSSLTSLTEAGSHSVGVDPFDFSCYMDQAPLTVQTNSPLQLVQEYFVKLGARYVVVTDLDGYYEGVIDKTTWLAFLNELEEKSS
ncbi:hypothetical protein OBBRIDRAFT_748976 [Obba rivulosa]|uniref:Chloride channel protein n=1 Tax=Obba rivulosa TaxID=1052685 RepID=A0A8E2J5J3_9APHY|nr:hypothetical protein OBBRIDRAFT_748976 [Obba rivulosa]